MIWTGNFKNALGSLRQTKWRSTFTMMGIIIGISSVITIASLGEGLKHQIVGQVNDLGSNVLTIRPGKIISGGNINLLALLSASNLNSKDIDALANLPSVKSVAPIDFVTSSASGDAASADNIFVAGTTPEITDFLHQKIIYGGMFQDEDANVAIIGHSLAQQLFHDPNPIGHSVTINGQSFIVRGVFDQSASGFLSVAQADLNSSIFIPFSAAQTLTNNQTNILQLFVKSSGNVDETQKEVTKSLIASHGQQDFTVLRQKQLLDVTGKLVNTATGFISAIAAISLLVGGIGIMDIMLVSVSERMREIGVRKAVGATNRQILNQFLVEGLVLTLGGGLIGIAIAFAINGLMRLYSPWKPVINVPIVIIAVTVSVAVGLVFSIAPAIKAARKDPIEALRGD
jgi:ABC-type antimicrobial peptide transport system permease subunit